MKAWNVCCLVWVFVTAFVGDNSIEGAAMFSTDPCPPGVNPGEDWFPAGRGCERCSCNNLERQPGYSCYTCGLIWLTRPGCYVEKSNPDKNYPECCQIEEFCPGDERYNTSRAGGSIVG